MEPIDSLSRGAIALGTLHEELYPFSVSTIRVGIGGIYMSPVITND
jgi:hypothetical protein